MKERPILFSAPMVRAILDGSKTQTRRTAKITRVDGHPERPDLQIATLSNGRQGWLNCQADHPSHISTFCPYGQPGDRLWVRETWNVTHHSQLAPGENIAKSAEDCVRDNNGFMPSCAEGVVYAADGVTSHPVHGKARWRPSIHMPRWASRILLEIVSVRVERLQDISEDDAQAEGIAYSERFCGYCIGEAEHFNSHDPRQSYFSLWEAINGAGSVIANPWVWVVEFRRVEPTEVKP